MDQALFNCVSWYKCSLILQGQGGLPGIRGPQGEKVCLGFVSLENVSNVLGCWRICACVLVFLPALMTAASPLSSFVLLQGEIGRPGSKVSRSSPPACRLPSLVSLWPISHVLGIMGSECLSPSSPLCILHLCDVICLLMCSEYPLLLLLLNGSRYISPALSMSQSSITSQDVSPLFLPSILFLCFLLPPLSLSLARIHYSSYWTPVLLIQALQHSTSAL